LTALVVLAALAVPPQTAGASVATSVDGTFSITPARRYLVARPPVRLSPARVSNTTPAPLQVKVIPVLLGQQPSGAFSFGTTPATLAAARSLLSAEPTQFTLAPGASRGVSLHWRRLVPHARTANVGVIYQAVPVEAQQGRQMRIVEQLLNVNLMRLPGHYLVLGSLTGLHVSQAAPKVLAFTLGVHNEGQVFAKPSHMTISVYRSGRCVLRRSLVSDVVLPGVTREFVLNLTRTLPPGRYTAIGRARFGSSGRLVAQSSFALTGPNELPSSQLHVGRLIAGGEVGGPADVSAAVSNTGTAAGATAIALHLYRLEDGVSAKHAIADGQLETGQVAPGDRARIDDELGHLRKGTYRLLASYRNPAGGRETLVADFQAREPQGLLAQLRTLLREHLLLIPSLLLLICLALLIALLLRERSLKRALAAARRQLEGRDRAEPSMRFSPARRTAPSLRVVFARRGRTLGGLAASGAALAAAAARRR
jgi:hypothetical protein